MTVEPHKAPLFNSPLETGVRAVVLLNAAHPESYDLSTLTLLDHLVVHTEDIGGPPSLHPSLPQRTGELLVRRKVVEAGLVLMRRLHLVDISAGKNGITYAASDDAFPTIELMRSSYSVNLRSRASWLAEYVQKHGIEDLRQQLSKRIDVWAAEFQEITSPGGSLI